MNSFFFNKRASLELSVNFIVILVISMVVFVLRSLKRKIMVGVQESIFKSLSELLNKKDHQVIN